VSELPLSRYTVLDLTIARAGPTAVRLLSDWGANVIRIEAPPDLASASASIVGDRRGSDQQNLHRNKRGLAIDLKQLAGRELFLDLARQADIVVENFRPDVKKRLGIDYEAVRAVNPRIIYGSISGFGQSGPYEKRPAVDQIIQGMSGLMSVTGEPERGPMRVGIAVSDTAAGMFLGQGILLALLQREHTGEGQWVHTSLLESMLSKLDFQGARYTMSGEVAEQQGNDHPTLIPMGVFEASDGLVNIAAPSNKMFFNMCRCLGADAIAGNPDYASGSQRAALRDQLRDEINALTGKLSCQELVDKLNAADVPCGPINNIGDAFEDQQVATLGMVRSAQHPELGKIDLVRSPINLSTFPVESDFNFAGPDPGAHSDEVLGEFGYNSEQIKTLRYNGTIA
jgi:crotonobetainyl-CoA:carnitine CoA-transferase CaiB-like acyl-CoA transferase